MKRLFFLLSLVFGLQTLYAQNNISTTSQNVDIESLVEENINSSTLSSFLNVLASDEFEGRETGQEGQRKAAAFIEGKFKEWGIPPVEGVGYQQPISFFTEKWYNLEFKVNDEDFSNMKDFYAYPSTNRPLDPIETNKIYFMGYGIDDPAYSDYEKNKVKGKVILIYEGEPVDENGNSLVTGTKEMSDWSSDFRKKLLAAKANGVEAVIIIDSQLRNNIGKNRNLILGGSNKMGELENANGIYPNNLFISATVAKAIVGDNINKIIEGRETISKGGRFKKVKLKGNFKLNFDKQEAYLQGSNVLAFIEGSDPKLKDQIVVVTAHYDHLGKRGESIFNGADDNGSGTSTVMAVAKALDAAKDAGNGPRRSVLCMLVSGEEKGLLGSKYYVNHPLFPLENTVVDINVDMVGRIDKKYEGNPNYVYVIGSDRLSTELHEINEAMNQKHTQLTLDYKYNDENDPNRYYYRSDHYNFAEKGIPAIFYFNGTHDDYHRPSDTVEKIDFDKMAKIGKLVFYTAWEIANRDKRIEVDVTD
jgi:hypothetical protein